MSAPARSDEELVAAHRGGDRRAFDELVRRHGDRLWAVALRTLRHREDASDAVQEALVAAYRRVDDYRGEASVGAWLHRIVVNACIDRIRRDRARPTVSWPEREIASPDRDPGHDVTTRLAVDDALALLPAEQRVAIVLVDVQGYPVAEVAAILEVAPGTVKSRCARGRARLAVLLGHLREVDR